MTVKQTFTDIELSELVDLAAEKKAAGYRCVNTHCVNGVDGVDIIYTFVVDGGDDVYENYRVKNVPHKSHIPSIQGSFPGVFPFENETQDLYGLTVDGMLLDFHFNFYSTDVSEPMTVITPEKKAAMEKAAKIAKAKAAKAAKEAQAKAAASAAPKVAQAEEGEDK